MDLKLVKKFIALAKKEGVKSLSYEGEGEKISVELPYEGSEISVPVKKAITPSENKKEVKSIVDESLFEVTAPFVGTFYDSPSPEDKSFVSKGAKVSKGDTLCILEAMKIMNEIEAEISGEIIEICVENEEFVEYGQVIMRIKKS